jgi:hypothetical protein
MNARDFADHLRDALEAEDELGVLLLRDVRTYTEVGMLTNNAGLVVRTSAGDVFQVTVVRTRHARDDEDEP